MIFSLVQSACVREDAELKSYNVMAYKYAVELGLSVTLQLQHYNYSLDFAYSIHLFGLHLLAAFFCFLNECNHGL